MFENFKYNRSLKRQNVIYMNELLGKAYNFVEGFPDILELAKRAKELDMKELQQLMAVEIVKYIKANEPTVAKDETVEE